MRLTITLPVTGPKNTGLDMNMGKEFFSDLKILKLLPRDFMADQQ